MKKSLSSYTDCSIHLFFMYSQEEVRSSPQKEILALLSSVKARIQELRYDTAKSISSSPTPLAVSLSAVERSTQAYSRTYRTFLAAADPASRRLGLTRVATSALYRSLMRIEDLAAKAAEDAATQATLPFVTEFNNDRRFLPAQPLPGRPAAISTWPTYLINRFGEAAKLAGIRKAARQQEISSDEAGS